jgi:DNA-binding winged helix-turn-helix (wHTH) protein
LRIRFGDFAFDREARELSRSGERVELSPKAFQLLEALLCARPRALTRAELTDHLWPGTAVGYTSLAGVATELRKALADDSHDQRFLRTVHGFGYAFCGQALDEPGSAAQVAFPCGLTWEGREIGLAEGENMIGREEGCAIRIDAAKVSRRHARILVHGRTACIEDAGSKNGTFLHGRKLAVGTDLADGDEIVIGGARLIFHAAYGLGSTAGDSRSGSRRAPSST